MFEIGGLLYERTVPFSFNNPTTVHLPVTFLYERGEGGRAVGGVGNRVMRVIGGLG